MNVSILYGVIIECTRNLSAEERIGMGCTADPRQRKFTIEYCLALQQEQEPLNLKKILPELLEACKERPEIKKMDNLNYPEFVPFLKVVQGYVMAKELRVLTPKEWEEVSEFHAKPLVQD